MRILKILICFFCSIAVSFVAILLINPIYLKNINLEDIKHIRFNGEAEYINTDVSINPNVEINNIEVRENVLISSNEDPTIVIRNVNNESNYQFLYINIQGLSVPFTQAQIFYINNENPAFSEEASYKFMLRNGLNIIKMPVSDYSSFRFDFTVFPEVSFQLQELFLSESLRLFPGTSLIFISSFLLINFLVLCSHFHLGFASKGKKE